MGWFEEFVESARATDTLVDRRQHTHLLAVGLLGEAGSILAEVKKEVREGSAYSARTDKMEEEFGDFLWYYARLLQLLAPDAVGTVDNFLDRPDQEAQKGFGNYLELGAAAGGLLKVINRQDDGPTTSDVNEALWRLLESLARSAASAGVDLEAAASGNTGKRLSRWPSEREYEPFFDEGLPEEEQLPRHLELDFLERDRAGTPEVLLRCNGINLGDRLTDNAWGGDDYRYHDVFHFGHAVYLGWSPVVRALLNCKRKSYPSVDENEDGARARILEEAVSAVVFVRAKRMNYFESIEHLDYDLLKTIHAIVEGYEVEMIPLWQWEEGILKSYAVFRQLRDNRGGRVSVDLEARALNYQT